MLDRVKFETVSLLAKIEVRTQEDIDREEEERRQRLMRALQAQHAEAASVLSADGAAAQAASDAEQVGAPIPMGSAGGRPAALPPAEPLPSTFVRSERKVGRNEPCPCGSGKKYKHCHGALAGNE